MPHLAQRASVTKRTNLQFLLALVFVLVCTGTVIQACNIPVFRYALENWRPDPYQIFILHRGELNDDQAQLLRQLEQAPNNVDRPANLSVTNIDLDSLANENEIGQLLAAEYGDRDLTQPLITMFYPSQANELVPVWNGTLNQSNLAAVIDSPAREEIRKRLIDGQSAVWVFIPSGDEAKDAEAEKMLGEQLEQMKQTVELPAQDLIEAEEEFQADNPIDLRVDFSYVKVDRNDPQEAPFVSSLLHSEPDLAELKEPITLPIYGRGRTYFALVGKGINPVTIEENCQFICGACSCQVKQSNPGVDTLMAFDWDSKVIGSAMKEIELPELTGIGHFESNPVALASNVSDEDLESPTTPKATPPETEAEHAAAQSSDSDSTPSNHPDDAQDDASEAIVAESASPFERSLLFWTFGAAAGVALIVGIFSAFLFRGNG